MQAWRGEFAIELEQAARARQRGNEGRARVCARRAAGIAGREFLASRGETVGAIGAYGVLNLIAEDERYTESIRQCAKRLTMRVSEEFRMPQDVDLIEEARLLAELLAGD